MKINIAHAKLSGQIPDSIGKLSQLQELKLNNNNIEKRPALRGKQPGTAP
jgi:Leucine-rich repeat (LRR) protein